MAASVRAEREGKHACRSVRPSEASTGLTPLCANTREQEGGWQSAAWKGPARRGGGGFCGAASRGPASVGRDQAQLKLDTCLLPSVEKSASGWRVGGLALREVGASSADGAARVLGAAGLPPRDEVGRAKVPADNHAGGGALPE
eukprot:223194-Pleurochrysis_carterae.AAC.1